MDEELWYAYRAMRATVLQELDDVFRRACQSHEAEVRALGRLLQESEEQGSRPGLRVGPKVLSMDQWARASELRRTLPHGNRRWIDELIGERRSPSRQPLLEADAGRASGGAAHALGAQDVPGAPGTQVRIGDLVLDLHSRRVLGDGRPVQLSPLEARILHLLAIHQGDVVPYTKLLESVWDGDEKGSVAALKTHVSHLRKKLVASSRRARARNWINMVSGVGYSLSLAGQVPRRSAAA